jgi:GNAT superfamily N-acetyltransferase
MRGKELETFEIRPAGEHDAAAMAEVFLQAGRAAWSEFVDVERMAAFELPVDQWMTGAVLVAEDGDGVVGFTSTHTAEEEEGLGVLATLYTRPSAWGRGAGRALLDAALAALRAQGCREAILWTEERNARARHVYDAGGWRLDGAVREREWQGAPLRELRYRRRLDPAP